MKKPTEQSKQQTPLQGNKPDLPTLSDSYENLKAGYNSDKSTYFKPIIPNSFKNPPPTDEQIKEAMKKLDSIVERMQNEFMKNRTLVDITPTTTSIVQVTSDHDKILDIINTMPDRLRNKALDILSTPSKEHAIFMSVLDEYQDRNYAILLNHLGDEENEPGLMFMSSTDQDAVCAMLAEISNVTYEEAKKNFSGPGEDS
jgi:hypothetical protein